MLYNMLNMEFDLKEVQKGIPYINVNDEMEADYIAYCIGGYYKSNGRTVYV